jgi:TetR/AcrR family transcriptional repressor of nem operon
MQEPKKIQTRSLILAGAGRTFRSHGYGGAGVDGVAKAAGVTSGAFYAYFKSKAEAFRETVVAGMEELEAAVRKLRAERDSAWVAEFVDFYLGEKRTCELTESCALQSLTGEVARADPTTRAAYEATLRGVMNAVAEGIDAPSAKARRQAAIVMLALLSGGVSLARAVNDPVFSDEIAAAIRDSLTRRHPPAKSKRRAKRAR